MESSFPKQRLYKTRKKVKQNPLISKDKAFKSTFDVLQKDKNFDSLTKIDGSTCSQEVFSEVQKTEQKQQEINPQDSAIITQNVPFSVSVPKVNTIYISINILLLILYFLTIVVGFIPSQNPLPIIIIVCFTFVFYIVYLFSYLKYSVIKSILISFYPVEQYKQYFQKLRNLRAYFKVTLLGDKQTIIQKDEIKQFQYETVTIDRLGNFYQIPNIINHVSKINEKNTNKIHSNIQEYYQEKKLSNQSHLWEEGQQNKQNNQNRCFCNLILNQKYNLTLVFCKFTKKYYYSNGLSKVRYLNEVQQFINKNNYLFNYRKQIKGYRKIQYIIDNFQQEAVYLMITEKTQMKNLQEINQAKAQNKMIQRKNEDKIGKDSNTIILYQSEQIDLPQKIFVQGLISKKKKRMEENEVKKTKERQREEKITQNEVIKNHQLYKKWMTILKMIFWMSLLMGFGSLLEWWLLRKYVKKIEVRVVKQITSQVKREKENQQKRDEISKETIQKDSDDKIRNFSKRQRNPIQKEKIKDVLNESNVHLVPS